MVVPAVVPARQAPGGAYARFTVVLGEDGYPVPPGEYRVYADAGTVFLGPFPLTVTE